MSIEELCANCGRSYEEHFSSTKCFEGQDSKWFPATLANAIVAQRQAAQPKIEYSRIKEQIIRDIAQLYEALEELEKGARE
jgi:hypothetical protein